MDTLQMFCKLSKNHHNSITNGESKQGVISAHPFTSEDSMMKLYSILVSSCSEITKAQTRGARTHAHTNTYTQV